MTVSATAISLLTLVEAVKPGRRMLVYTSTLSRIWCRVWLIPAAEKALRRLASVEPTACIRTRMQGPRPASRVEPVRVPTGMDSSLVDTSDSRRRISSAIWDRRRLKAAMLLSRAATRPVSSFSR